VREIYDLESEAARIEAELEEVVGHRTDYDDNGNAVPVPVYRFAPETREGRQRALQDVRYRLAQIEREAPARRTAAAALVQQRIAAENEQQAIHAEAKKQAEAQLRQERVDHLASAFAKNRSSNLG